MACAAGSCWPTTIYLELWEILPHSILTRVSGVHHLFLGLPGMLHNQWRISCPHKCLITPGDWAFGLYNYFQTRSGEKKERSRKKKRKENKERKMTIYGLSIILCSLLLYYHLHHLSPLYPSKINVVIILQVEFIVRNIAIAQLM